MAHNDPLLIEGPKANTEASAAPIIDLEAVKSTDESPSAEAAAETVTPEHASNWNLPTYVPLAAGLMFAIALGAIAGAAATSSLLGPSTPPANTAADTNRALQDSVAQLTGELSTLKASIATAQRSANTQFGKLSERIDRSDKAQVQAQAEPTAKLAKIQEVLDKLDRRQQVAAVAAPEVTGSVAPKEESKPQIAEGWRLRDFYSGRALVESKNGALFEVAPGSNLPGLGKVETIKRENGKVVVTTQKGIIAASLTPRRPSYEIPYRY